LFQTNDSTYNNICQNMEFELFCFLSKYHLKLTSLLQEFQIKTTYLSEINSFLKKKTTISFPCQSSNLTLRHLMTHINLLFKIIITILTVFTSITCIKFYHLYSYLRIPRNKYQNTP
jgi:hypothetical protein